MLSEALLLHVNLQLKITNNFANSNEVNIDHTSSLCFVTVEYLADYALNILS